MSEKHSKEDIYIQVSTDYPLKKGRYRYIVLAASFLALFFNTSLDYATGVLYVAVQDTYQSDVDVTVWLGSVFFCMFGLAGPLASFIINVSDCRTCVFISGLLGLVGFSVNVFISDIRWLFLTYAFIAGTGGALAHTGALVVLGYYFEDNISLACGICVCGMATGLFVHPPLCQLLINMYGLREAFLIIGAIAFHSCICGLLMTPTKFEIERRKQVFSGHTRRLALLRSFCGDCNGYVKIFTNKAFLFFFLSGMAFGMGLSAQYLFLPDYLQKRGISRYEASFSVSLSGLGGVLSRVLTGFAAQDSAIGSGLIFSAINGLMGVVTLLVHLLASSAYISYVYGFLVGLYTGGTWALFNPITFEILGLELVASGLGALMFAVGVGCLFGPPLAGYVYEWSDTYYGAFVFAAAMFFLCAMSGFLSTSFRKSTSEINNIKEHGTNGEEAQEMIAHTDNHTANQKRISVQ